MNDVMGIINLSESEEQIKDLTLGRSLGALHILGRYRIIDFQLSNMVNSGLSNVAIFTYGKSHSIMLHVGSGKPWGLDRKRDGLYIFYPEINTEDNIRRQGDLDNFRNHLDYLQSSTQKYVILSRSYMLANIDYKDVVQHHRASGSDVTIVYKNIEKSYDRFPNCDTLTLNDQNRVIGIGKNLGKQENYNVSMEMYVMKRDRLIKIIESAIQRGDARFLKEAIFQRLPELKVGAYRFNGYLSCIQTINNYFETNMELLNTQLCEELFGKNGPIYTKVMDAPSTYYSEDSYVSNSLVANGCIIEGKVENSIIHRDVRIKKGAVVRNSILLPYVTVSEATNLNYVILDKHVTITPRKMLFGDQCNPFVIKKNMVL
ncbi:glucose-1-phosphate adenylyltransferase subunit GlgD [Acidaminobacter hydrogenoformans]|uniref:Glucose-1-phosphate adenylyltransferase n=1 Tax=Acidaminobacter hydrogenoformans DSM 2784 TaxID=1120920 RepID=A0A1G5RZU7_9FIRM|nr:glucose-1-phosphate adenylyltransferase subunit GlgD [Acidaminobacter hydrogenoformans]SCZ78859.1 glucose-1-phosphate adenylyltransferase [Acidaminobacter hydrogenoformans DSM 2784]